MHSECCVCVLGILGGVGVDVRDDNDGWNLGTRQEKDTILQWRFVFLLVLVGRSNSIRVDGQDLYSVGMECETEEEEDDDDDDDDDDERRGEVIAESSKVSQPNNDTCTSFRLYVPLELAEAERGVSTRLE